MKTGRTIWPKAYFELTVHCYLIILWTSYAIYTLLYAFQSIAWLTKYCWHNVYKSNLGYEFYDSVTRTTFGCNCEVSRISLPDFRRADRRVIQCRHGFRLCNATEKPHLYVRLSTLGWLNWQYSINEVPTRNESSNTEPDKVTSFSALHPSLHYFLD